MNTAIWARWIGLLSLILLLAAWVLFWPAPFWPTAWDSSLYGIAIFLAALAGILGLAAGWMHSGWWYILSVVGFASCTLMLLGLA